MTDTRLRNASFALFIFFAVIYTFVAIKSCNKENELQPIIVGEKKHFSRTADTSINVIPPSEIKTVEVIKIVYRDRWHEGKVIHDSADFVAYSDTITAAHGTQLQISYSSKKNVFSLPYLKERDDKTITIRDSTIVETTVKAQEESTFWSDVGKITGGIAAGLLIAIGVQ